MNKQLSLDMKIYSPKTTSGKFARYIHKLVIIVANEKKLGKVYIPDAVYKALGEPEFINVGVRGNVMYFWKSEPGVRGYKVGWNKNRPNEFKWITIATPINDNDIRAGIYDASSDGATIMFDFAQRPSQL